MRGFIVGTVITAIAFYVMTKVLPQYMKFDLVTYQGELIGLVVLAVIFGLVNGVVGPIVRALALPLSFMTLGLVGFLVNGGLLLLTAFIADSGGFDLVTYQGELIGLVVLAVIFGLVNGVVGPIVRALALPLSFMTLGLVGFLVNGGLLLLTAFIADSGGFDLTVGDFPPDLLTADTIVAAVVGAAILSLVSTAVRLVVPD